ncbi:MAG: hypothetical protein QXU98_05525 [Candidatus Parvarchaeota archaeon]
MNEQIEINETINAIGISAHSGYGKTYLSIALLKQFIEAGYYINILSYTKESEAFYWKQFENNKQVNIDYVETPNIFEMIKFIIKHIKDQSILYINDADLYLNSPEYSDTASNLILNILSSIRKTNSKIIFEFKSIKGMKFLNILEQLDLLFIGYFTRQMPIFDSINPEIKDNLALIDTQEHDFVYVYGKDVVGICYVDKEGNIVKKKTTQEYTQEYYELIDEANKLISNINVIEKSLDYDKISRLQEILNEIFVTNIIKISNTYNKYQGSFEELKEDNPLYYEEIIKTIIEKIKEYFSINKDKINEIITKYETIKDSFEENMTKYEDYQKQLKQIYDDIVPIDNIIKQTNSQAYIEESIHKNIIGKIEDALYSKDIKESKELIDNFNEKISLFKEAFNKQEKAYILKLLEYAYEKYEFGSNNFKEE